MNVAYRYFYLFLCFFIATVRCFSYVCLFLFVYVCVCVCISLSLSFSLFLGSGPKGPMSCRTQGWISLRPSVRTYVRPSVRPPPSFSGLKSSLLGLKSSLLGLKPSLSGFKFSLNNMANWQKTEKNAKFPMNIMENYPKYALSGRMEIHPCVLQDPLGPLPKKLWYNQFLSTFAWMRLFLGSGPKGDDVL